MGILHVHVYVQMKVHGNVSANVSVCPKLTPYPSSLAHLAPYWEFLWCLPAPAPWLQFSSLAYPSFTLSDVHGVLEWETIPGQWPWQTDAGALVPAGHTKVYNWHL